MELLLLVQIDMIKKTVFIFILYVAGNINLCDSSPVISKVLVFYKTKGFHHNSIIAGTRAITKLGSRNNFDVTCTDDPEKFTDKNLQLYKAVIFLNTTGNVLNSLQQKAFENYMKNGGGFMGIHSAADTEYDWPWYGKLVGAYFKSHPAIQNASLNVFNSEHISTKHLPKQWLRKDEWYNFKFLANDLKVLITIDESSYRGGENGKFHPICWYHNYAGGKAFYTALGHTKKSYSDPLFLNHLLGGIKFVIGTD